MGQCVMREMGLEVQKERYNTDLWEQNLKEVYLQINDQIIISLENCCSLSQT